MIKYLLIFFFISNANAIWRPASIPENPLLYNDLNKAALQINNKVDRFSKETIYGQKEFDNQLTVSSGVVVSGLITTGSIYTSPGGAYLDGNAVGGDYAHFVGAISTTTFDGWIDIGLVYVSSASTSGAIRLLATCPSTTRLISGGCRTDGGNNILNSPQSGTSRTVWECYWDTPGTNEESIAICGRIK